MNAPLAAEALAARVWPADGAAAVPYWVYSDPEVYALERRRVFARSWNYVALEAEIPDPGCYRRSFAGDVPVVVMRTKDGRITCVVNRCAHRGMELVQAPCGRGTTLVCPYHQWSFDLDGRLVGLPYRRGAGGKGGMPDDFDPACHGLERLRVATRHGAVFASLDPEEPDLAAWMGQEMCTWFDRTLDGRPLTILGRHRQRVRANWKLYAENLRDPYHGGILHVWYATYGLVRVDNPGAVILDPTGRHCVLAHWRAPDSSAAERSSRAARAALHDARVLALHPEREGPGVTMQALWPNVVVATQQNALAMRHLIPRGPAEFDLEWTSFGYADDTPEMHAHRVRQANLGGPAGFISIDDGEVLALTARGVAIDPAAQSVVQMGGRDTTSCDHVVTEVGVRAFYAHYRRVMGF